MRLNFAVGCLPGVDIATITAYFTAITGAIISSITLEGIYAASSNKSKLHVRPRKL